VESFVTPAMTYVLNETISQSLYVAATNAPTAHAAAIKMRMAISASVILLIPFVCSNIGIVV
jgi:hypothetical protein